MIANGWGITSTVNHDFDVLFHFVPLKLHQPRIMVYVPSDIILKLLHVTFWELCVVVRNTECSICDTVVRVLGSSICSIGELVGTKERITLRDRQLT